MNRGLLRRLTLLLLACIPSVEVSLAGDELTLESLIELFRIREEQLQTVSVAVQVQTRYAQDVHEAPPWTYVARHGVYEFAFEHGEMRLLGNQRDGDGSTVRIDSEYVGGVGSTVLAANETTWGLRDPDAHECLPDGRFPLDFVVTLEGRPLSSVLQQFQFEVAESRSDGECILRTPVLPGPDDSGEEYQMTLALDRSRGYALKEVLQRVRRGGEAWVLHFQLRVDSFHPEMAGLYLPHEVQFRHLTWLLADPDEPLDSAELMRESSIRFTDWALAPGSHERVRFPEATFVNDRVTGSNFVATEVTDQDVLDAGARMRERSDQTWIQRYRSTLITTIAIVLVFLVAMAAWKGARKAG